MSNTIDDEKNEVVSRLAFYLGAVVILASMTSLVLTIIGVIRHILA